MTGTMRAVALTGHGGFECLEYRTDFPKPELSCGEVLVRVLACGLNNTDINTRVGWYSKSVTEGTTGSALETAEAADSAWGGRGMSFPRIQGADVCGLVEEVGSGVDRALIGQRVLIDPWIRDWSDPENRDKIGYFGSESDGGFAEFTKVPAGQVHPVDCELSSEELATFSTSWITALNMLERASVNSNDRLLVTGASGGVGTALLQLAKLRGATVIAMCGEDKADQVRETAAVDAVLPRNPPSLVTALQEHSEVARVTVVADVVGGQLFPHLINALEPGGRYVASGAVAGPCVSLDLRDLYLKDLSFFGATVTESGLFARLVDIIEQGKINPVLARVYPLKELCEAQRAFLSKKLVGNIVVRL